MDQSAINTEELRKLSREWNLACDVNFFKKLQNFSENVLSNTKSTLSHMDELEDNLNKTFINVKTTINNFHGIADNQFIENRVEEDEDTMICNQDFENSAPITMEHENLESKINACADSLSKRFETIEIDLEDENGRHIILKPKNRYKDRKLPHIVGSREFLTDGSLGLSKLEMDAESSSGSDDDYESPERIITPNKKFTGGKHKNDLAKSSSTTTIETESSQNTNAISNIDIDADVEPHKPSSVSSVVDGNVLEKDIPVLPKFDIPKTPPESEEGKMIYIQTDASGEGIAGILKQEDETGVLHPVAFFSEKLTVEQKKKPPNYLECLAVKESIVFWQNYLIAMEGESIQARLSKILMQNNDKFSRTGPPKLSQNRDDIFKDKQKDYRSDSGESADEDIFNQSFNYAGDVNVKNKKEAIIKEKEPQKKSLSASVSEVHPAQGIQPDDLLPNVPTKILHSLSRDRPKIQAKRRLPTRIKSPEQIPSKPTSVNISEKVKDTESKEIKDDWVLSPMTDEEDLFVLPALNLPKDSSSNNLFSGTNLLSPGTSIDTPQTNINKVTEPIEHKTNLKDLMETDDDDDKLFSEDIENPFKKKSEFSWKFDSSEDLFSSSKPTNLLSSLNQNDLFSSSKSEDDLFSSKKDILFKSEDDLFSTKNESSTKTATTTKTTSQTTTKKSDLFDVPLLYDDEDDDINLFSSGNKRTYQFSASDDLFTSSSQPVTAVKDISKVANPPKKEKLFKDPLFQENMEL